MPVSPGDSPLSQSPASERKSHLSINYTENDGVVEFMDTLPSRPKSSSLSLGLPQCITPQGSLRGRPANNALPQTLNTPETTPQLTPRRRAMEKLEQMQLRQMEKFERLHQKQMERLEELQRQHTEEIAHIRQLAASDQQQPDEPSSAISGMKGLIPLSMAPPEEEERGGANGKSKAPPRARKPYSVDSDPLLQDDEEFEKRALVGFLQHTLVGFFVRNKSLVWKAIVAVLLTGYTVYFGFAIAYSPYGAIAPCVFTGLVLLYWLSHRVQAAYGSGINEHLLAPLAAWWDGNWDVLRWFVYPAPLFMLIIYLSIMLTDVKQLQSLSGFIIFFFSIWITSKHPDKVVWRPVLWGYTLQFIMGLMVLQWQEGYEAVKWLSDYVTKIINFGYEGAAVVYGDPTMVLHPFVMMGLSLLVYVGAIMSILYYYGVTQFVAAKLAWAMAVVMGTTAIETMGVSANIMLNGMDVMLMLRPYLMKLTISEFNCFLVGGHATIAGFMFGILILYGAPAQHLLSGAVMSAPATIAIAKLSWPETTPERSLTKDVNSIRLSKGQERSVFEAAANGSAVAGRTIATVVVNYISFMSILYFVDATLSWFGGRVGFPDLSFEWLCSYIFYPVAFIIGIEVNQCRQIAKVIGLKVLTTEVYSYQRLGQLYDDGLIDERSKALGTYALCGFCSLSTLAIAVGVWEVVCPPRRPLMSRLMPRAMFQANLSCFTTACIAGLFYSDKLAMFDSAESSPLSKLITWIFDQIPKLTS